MYERLKTIRSKVKLNQSDFAKALGIGQSTLAMMEVGKREILDRHIKTICSIFKVNEEWLRTGNGEIFIENKESIIEKLVKEEKIGVWIQRLLDCYLDLKPAQRVVVDCFFEKFAQSFKDENNTSFSNTIDNLNFEESQAFLKERNKYIKQNASQFAAANGDSSNLDEAQELYDKSQGGENE